MLALTLVYERDDGKLQAICLDRQLEYMAGQGESIGLREHGSAYSKRTLVMRWTGERTTNEVDLAVQEYNKQFDKTIPTNVWLGRPLRVTFIGPKHFKNLPERSGDQYGASVLKLRPNLAS